ncbi:MAG: aminotransferase class I/II-fold pyridoxal phosphate-dependent enzyme, partial [Rhodanobacter sp.]
MAAIEPSTNLAKVHYDIRGALNRRAREIEAGGRDLIKLNIGNPGRYGFETPAHLREAVASHLSDSEAYGHEQGLEVAREAIAAQQQARGARGVDVEHIFIGNGVSELIDLALRALLQSGDEVLLPSPDYPLWSAATLLNGGQPRYYRCLAENGHLPDPDEIEAMITPRSRALVLINPNNPTGAVYPRALLERLVTIAARHRLLLLCDEIYDEILYDGAIFQPLAELAGELPCLSFGGLSKMHRACGYRVGWMSLSGKHAHTGAYRDALQLLAALRLCANVPVQWAIAPALQNPATIPALITP